MLQLPEQRERWKLAGTIYTASWSLVRNCIRWSRRRAGIKNTVHTDPSEYYFKFLIIEVTAIATYATITTSATIKPTFSMVTI